MPTTHHPSMETVIQGEAIAECLGRAGLAVQMAHYGASALRQAAALQPRAALLEYYLPDTTGVELAGHLGAFPARDYDHHDVRSYRRPVGNDTRDNRHHRLRDNPLPLHAVREAVLKLVRSTPVDQMAWCQQKGRLSAGFGGTRH
jgi:CheY-like chemotaxis protein